MPTRQLVTKLIMHNPDYWGSDSAYGKPLTEHGWPADRLKRRR